MERGTYPNGTYTYENGKPVPGGRTCRLTKAEACRSAFAFATGRQPADDEINRLSIYVNEEGCTTPWELVLTLEDAPELPADEDIGDANDG